MNQFPIDDDMVAYWYGWNDDLIYIVTNENGELSGESLIVYDVNTGAIAYTYEFSETDYFWVNFNQDGTLGILGGWADPETREQYQVSVFETASGEIIEQYVRDRLGADDTPFGAGAVGFNPDASIVWFGGHPNYFIDRATGEDILTINYWRIFWLNNQFTQVILPSPENPSREYVIIDLATGEETPLPNIREPRTSGDGYNIVAGTHGQPRYRQLIDRQGRNDEIAIFTDLGWMSSAFNPSGTQIIIADNGISAENPEGVHVIDIASNEIVYQYEGEPFEGFDIDWSPNGQYFAAGNRDGEVIIWDAQNGQEYRRLSDFDQPQIFTLQFTPDSQHIVAGFGSPWTFVSYDVNPYLLVWDIETGDVVSRIEFSAGEEQQNWGFAHLDIHPDGRLATVTVADTYVTFDAYVYDLWTGEILYQLPEGFLDGVFTPDGEEIVFGSESGMIYVVSVESGDIIRQWQSLDDDQYLGNTISADGRYLATGSGPGSSDGAVSIWDIGTGELIRRYTGHESQSFIIDIDISSDGKYLMSGSVDSTVHLYEFDPQSTLDWVLENRVVRDLECSERITYRIEPYCEEKQQ